MIVSGKNDDGLHSAVLLLLFLLLHFFDTSDVVWSLVL